MITLLNQLIPYHKDYAAFSQKHLGKTCQIVLETQSYTFYIHQSGIHTTENPADGMITLNEAGLLSCLGFKVPNANIVFSKDHTLCQDLARLCRIAAIDQESLLFDLLPDTMAMLTIEGCTLLQQSLKRSHGLLSSFLQQSLHDIAANRKETNSLYEKTIKLHWLIESLQ